MDVRVIDRDKIISAWMCCNNELPNGRCEKCPFGYGKLDTTGDNAFWFCDIDRIADDAVLELTFRNASLLTEYGLEVLDAESVVWIEYRARDKVVPAIFCEWRGISSEFATRNGIINIRNDGYKKWWRCWVNECPNMEKRKEMKWECQR